ESVFDTPPPFPPSQFSPDSDVDSQQTVQPADVFPRQSPSPSPPRTPITPSIPSRSSTPNSQIMPPPSMPLPSSNNAPRWDGLPRNLRNYIWQIECLFEVSQIVTGADKLRWFVSYVGSETRDEWMSFEEYQLGSWAMFLERLKLEYPEITMAEE